MRTAVVLAWLALPTAVAAAPFRPFVDQVGVTRDGLIITTTTASGQADPPTTVRHAVRIFAPDGAVVASVDAERAVEAGAPITRRHWRAIDAWLGALGARRRASRPLLERPCASHPRPGDEACPSDPTALVRTPAGLARWNVDGASPVWAWGEPQVVEVGRTCVVLLPNNNGPLDRTEAHAVPCPPPL